MLQFEDKVTILQPKRFSHSTSNYIVLRLLKGQNRFTLELFSHYAN